MSQPTFDIPPDLAEKLRHARHVAALSGAGISAESGIPTFRAAQTGLWARYDLQDLATPEAFQCNPRLVWEWYAWRRSLLAQAAPNPAHLALAEIERRVPRFTLITQNVDGLHQRGGSTSVIELHGNIARTKCFDEDALVEGWAETSEVPPRCPRCGGLLRPDVVWFGEALPPGALAAARDAAATCDLFFSIGTSGVVEPAASLPFLALKRGAVVVIVNPEFRASPGPTLYGLSGPAGRVLPALVRAAWPEDSDTDEL
jgi:NAD-dependent protein deacetylase/lipoamidase